MFLRLKKLISDFLSRFPDLTTGVLTWNGRQCLDFIDNLLDWLCFLIDRRPENYGLLAIYHIMARHPLLIPVVKIK